MRKVDHRALLSTSTAKGAAQRHRMMQRDLIASGRWDEAMDLEYDDMKRVAAKNGQPGLYDDAIDRHRAQYGGGPC
jgi:hypothetical protein